MSIWITWRWELDNWIKIREECFILEQEYITVKELQSILKISKSQAYELTSLSDFPKIRIGRSIRIPQQELEKYLKHNLYKVIDIK